jgi:outer membrane protein
MRLAGLLLLAALPAHAADTVTLSLHDCETRALSYSHLIKNAQEEQQAEANYADEEHAPLLPRLLLEGSAKYTDIIPKMSLNIGAMHLNEYMTDNWNYSLGPSLYWTAYDSGEIRLAYESAKNSLKAKDAAAEDAIRQNMLSTRLAYFQVVLQLEQVYLIGDELKLASQQHADIALNARAGTKTRLDELQAHQQLLERQRQLRQARADLSAALRDLAALTGDNPGDASLALDARMNYADYDSIEPASLLVSAQQSQELLAAMSPFAYAQPDPDIPSLRGLELSAAALRATAQSVKAGLGPKVQFSARTSLDYPNAMALYSFNQNSLGVSVSMPLFEGGRTSSQAQETLHRAAALDQQKLNLADTVKRDFAKAKDQYFALAAQQVLNREEAKEADEAAKLTYDSYKSGHSTYLEVQDANVRALSAKTQIASADAQMLIELAAMASMGKLP